ncbi:vasculin-like protein 1 [Aplochiton taeniatus]
MAQHDFVPAWLNFSTPQPAKCPAASLEKHGEPHHHRDGRASGSRRRHNSSDGFFNSGPLRAPAGGDGWQQPSLLLRHDSVDSGVAKGGHGGLAGGPCWKEAASWHGAPRGTQDSHQAGRHVKRGGGDRDRQGLHRQRNGNFHPRKGTPYQDKFPSEGRKEDKLKFVEEDFPSLNPETTGKPGNQLRPVAPHASVWEHPPSSKQMMSKMLVIKKVSKEDPSNAFSAGFSSASALPTNGSKTPISGSSVYKNLVPKPAVAPTKSTQWKPSGREVTKPGLHLPGRDSVFTSPVSAAKPSPPASAPQHNTPKELPSSTTPPIDIVPSRLKLMRRGPDRKSEFLRALKDEGSGELTASSPGTSGEGESSTPEPKAYSEEVCHENGLSFSDSDTEHLSSSLEAEHRLLKAMGWQEYPENDDSFQPLTEDELREFQTKTEQLKRNGMQRNGMLPRLRGVTLHFTPWRSVAEAHVEEGSDSETSSSSSQTSDDEDCTHA